MTEPNLDELVEAAAIGGRREIRALTAHLAKAQVDVARLAEIAGHHARSVRLAVARALPLRDREAEHGISLELASDPEEGVRLALVRALSATTAWRPPGVLAELLKDRAAKIRAGALDAACTRREEPDGVIALLLMDESWSLRQQAAAGARGWYADGLVGALLRSLGYDDDEDVRQAAAASLAVALSDGKLPDDVAAEGASKALHHLETDGGPELPELMAWLKERGGNHVDAETLRSYGTLLDTRAASGDLPHAYGVEPAVRTILETFARPTSNALVLLGEPGVGKTAIVQEAVHRLRLPENGGWTVVRVSPSDFLIGTRYIGEWQTRASKLVAAARAPQQVILYVPNVHELSDIGRSSSGDDNVATMLAPLIEDGAIRILGESTPDAFARGLGGRPGLRRLFKPFVVKEMDDEAARDVLRRVAEEQDAPVDELVLDRLHDLADLYLPGVAQPGRSVGLLREILDRAPDDAAPLTTRTIIDTLSSTSGIPADFLDDDVPLDLEAMRAFFEERVMGQPTAVSTVCDLLTLVKAGLTDPGKPLGVFLFVGPTGVGKTELARALAAYLFGSEKRLVRLDMSEYASYDAYQRLLGTQGEDGLLTGPVRQQPFSVVLLDEIEKGHANVFDLCLQIFDAGRLTDRKGRTVDFRRSIVILTSNVGAADAASPKVGFNEEHDEAAERETLFRALRRFFRPEFLNRLDRVVHFRSLTTATTRKIAEREVRRIAKRAGLRRRGLAIDVDPSALGVLVRHGHSREYGARPLKRTVERLLLQPMARAIAAGKAPRGAVLRVTPKQDHLTVAVVQPEVDETPPGDTADLRAAHEVIAERIERITAASKALADDTLAPRARKAALLAETHEPGFWNDRPRASVVLDEVHRLDQVLSQAGTLERRVRDTRRHAADLRPDEPPPAWIAGRLDELDRELARVRFLATCKDSSALGDAFVVLRGVQRTGDGLDAVERLAGMYRAAGERRGFEVEVLADQPSDTPDQDHVVLLLAGAGAAALFEHETGLHAVARGVKADEERDVVRVDVLPAHTGAAPLTASDVEVEARVTGKTRGRLLDRTDLHVRLTHRGSGVAIDVRTAGPRDQALAALVPYLAARVARPVPASDPSPVRRRYVLGPSPLVRDRRTGISTGHLERVLAGDLDRFLAVPE